MRIYPTNEAFAQGLKDEEFGIGVMWKARVVQWQNAGIPVNGRCAHRRHARLCVGLRDPEERAQQGGRLRLSRRHAREERAGSNFAVDMGYNPTVTNAAVAADLHKRIGFTPDEVKKRLVDLDYGYLDQERRRVEGVVGQGIQGVSRTRSYADSPPAHSREKGRAEASARGVEKSASIACAAPGSPPARG